MPDDEILYAEVCGYTWNPDQWPYVAKCRLPKKHSGDCISFTGKHHSATITVELTLEEWAGIQNTRQRQQLRKRKREETEGI